MDRFEDVHADVDADFVDERDRSDRETEILQRLVDLIDRAPSSRIYRRFGQDEGERPVV